VTAFRLIVLNVLRCAACAAALGAAPAGAGAPLTPAIVIYPGDILRADMFAAPAPQDEGALSAVLGKRARRTLLPGRPIGPDDLENPRAFHNGSQVKIVYRSGALEIVALGLAMQDASPGDEARARNIDSGVVVAGVARADGTLAVNE
jgi:flagella basal body P-ring formation protein FlgA